MYRISPQSFLHNPKGDLSVAQDIHFSQSNVFHFLAFLIFSFVTVFCNKVLLRPSSCMSFSLLSKYISFSDRRTSVEVPLASGEVGNWARLLLANRYMIFTRKCEYSLFSVLFCETFVSDPFPDASFAIDFAKSAGNEEEDEEEDWV